MKIRALVGLSLVAVLPVFADEPPRGEIKLVQPSPKPPVSRPGPVRGRLATGTRAAAEPTGELSGLRAVSLGEGSAVISLAGATRSVRPGDRIGALTVKAVGSDRLILERPPVPSAAPSAASGAAIVVVTFASGGEARVRTYARVTGAPPSPESR
jgi:hypothetical protein